MKSPMDSFCWWFRRQFWRWIGHVIVRRSRFESLDNSIGKIACKNFHVSEPTFFLNFEYSVCNSIGIYRPQYSVGIYWLNYRRKRFCRQLWPQITDRIILSVILLVLSEFLVVCESEKKQIWEKYRV
jgi:hypothetical protein